MRLTVILPSRGRPGSLREVITTMHGLSSGRHDVTYAVGCDSDDPATLATVWAMRVEGYQVQAHCSIRLASLGQIDNAVAAAFPADAYCALCDDVEIMTPQWDEAIHQAWAQRPDAVWWWRCADNMTCAIVSEKWRAAAGRIFTDYFPFWWDDMWLVQLWQYAAGQKILLVNARIRDRGQKTLRMRDLRFWADFFWSPRMRQQRIDEARRIAGLLGWPAIDDLKPHELQANPDFVPEDVEAGQGERSAPTPEYLAAKRRAELLQIPLDAHALQPSRLRPNRNGATAS